MIVHLVDGTYELFRHFYGQRRFNQGKDKPLAAVASLLASTLGMIEKGATHLGVATDHVIESFRNDMWPGYKTGEGIEPALLAQFQPLEDALAAMGVVVWPMTELEADDALASAARLAAEDERVEKVCIWANDKDLAQCVRGERVVQMDRRGMEIRDAEGVRKKFGVEPALIPDLLALVGDPQDGYPGIAGIGKVTAARLLNQHGPIEGVSTRRTRGVARAGAALQGSGHPQDRRSALRKCGRARVARPGTRVRGVGRAPGESSFGRARSSGVGQRLRIAWARTAGGT